MLKKIYLFLGVCAVLHVSFAFMAHAGTVVEWDSLKKLDVLAERCQALSEANDVAELRKLVKPVKAAMAIVVADPMPVGAKAPDQVKVLQSDLKSLADALTDTGAQADAELVAILAGIDPVVGKLMEAAGMPHVHENEDSTGESRP